MNILYLDCSMGASGDMLAGALLELHTAPEDFLVRFNALGISGIRVSAEKSVKCGITGTHFTVRVQGQEEASEDVLAPGIHPHDHSHEGAHEHAHSHGSPHDHSHVIAHEQHHNQPHNHNCLKDIEQIVSALALNSRVKENMIAVYSLIAKAESLVHGVPVDQIHFHEVGNMDAIADIAAVCMLFDEIAPERVISSPIQTGSGHVRCAHGILPVPAPAAAEILRGIPVYGGSIHAELCTPTGAALLKHFVSSFGPLPPLIIAKTGYGMGTKDFDAANCVRAFYGKNADVSRMEAVEEENKHTDRVCELVCALDDMTGEELSFARGVLLEKGALDVCLTPVFMKKGRPGYELCCLCRPEDAEKMSALMFKHTATLGIRERQCKRRVMDRSVRTVHTEFGNIRIKTARGYGTEKSKVEYDDLERAAKEGGVSLREAQKNVNK